MNQQQGRVVMHLDMDAFLVNVVLLDSPELQGVPIILSLIQKYEPTRN